jgi:hypothetical protein
VVCSLWYDLFFFAFGEGRVEERGERREERGERREEGEEKGWDG